MQSSFLENSSASASAIAIKRQLEALELGHEAQIEARKILEDINSATPNNMTTSVGAMLEDTQSTQNTFLCAAYLLGRARTDDKSEETFLKIGVSVFSRLAQLTSYMTERALKQMESAQQPTSQAAKIAEGRKFAGILKARDSAYSDLVDVTSSVAMQAIDSNGPKNQPVKFLNISCAEKTELLRIAKSANVSKPEDDFTKNAALIVTVLDRYQCHPRL